MSLNPMQDLFNLLNSAAPPASNLSAAPVAVDTQSVFGVLFPPTLPSLPPPPLPYPDFLNTLQTHIKQCSDTQDSSSSIIDMKANLKILEQSCTAIVVQSNIIHKNSVRLRVKDTVIRTKDKLLEKCFKDMEAMQVKIREQQATIKSLKRINKNKMK